MSWRIVVISNRAKLELHLGYLVIRNSEIKKIHLSEISEIIIESTSVSLTASLICELTYKKIKVVFCDEKRNPQSELVSYYGCHDTSLKIKKQIEWSKDWKDTIWTEIVTEKIRQQHNLLVELGMDEAELLAQYIEQIEFCDNTNREGHAAKVYFNAIFGKEFTRTSDCPINAALNYGYSIILSAVNREVVSNGYITQLGLFHDNMFNYYNLSCDIMEPLRNFVDREVISMNPVNFDVSEKHQLINLLNKQVIIDGKSQYLNNAIKIYCKSIFDALNDNDISQIRFCKDEL